MSIWFNSDLQMKDFIHFGKNTMGEFLGIEFVELGDDYIKATMPVDERTKQPYGLLHGGASVVLAETLGSIGAVLTVDPELFQCVGLEINANHIRGVKQGIVTGIARPIHMGATTQVWDIRIFDEREKLVCVSRHTVAVIKKKH
ncbi:MAG: hotdog fold thioesterase [Bacteroidota bacterium]|jgi:1,4-dihydroxy-2-naphthoyl-CoA hydrolase